MFWRLFGTYSVLLVVSTAFLGMVLAGRVERHHQRQVFTSLRTKAVLVREMVRDWPADRVGDLPMRMLALGREIGTRITLLAEDGRVLADSQEDPEQMENHAHRPEIRDAHGEEFGTATRFSSTLKKPMSYVAVRLPGNQTVGYVRVALPLDDIEVQLVELNHIMWTAAGATGVAAWLLALWLARRIIPPIQELTRKSERIAAGDYGHKVYRLGQDEVSLLARAFNHMSERLQVQFAQLDEDRQQLRTILSGMVEGVVALNAEQRILFANERAAQLLGFQTQTVIGRKVWEIVRHRTFQEVVNQALRGPEPCSRELVWDGSPAKCLTIHAARLPGPPARGAVLVFHDTTELRRLERLRQEFVANVSHELKTPLSIIKACIETLLDGAVDDPTHRGPFLEQIDDQANRLHMLILDLISLARIESGAEVFEFQDVPLEPVVHTCLERHRARAEGKQQQLAVVPPQDPSGREIAVWADEEAVSQILDNLVDNAVKYTPAGGRIYIRWRAENGQVCLEVEDTGIGIPEQDLPRIFERFYRVDKARSRALGGTGLGLSIVKHLVQAMHGTVQAHSRVGAGTTFQIRLPHAPAN
jgi:two-component system phosphate regulon sensor histidine kinase PhoR